jgi:PST family polysaccharide transporter
LFKSVRPQPDSRGPQSGGTYGQILKSSVLVGGSSIIGILIRIVRTKIMAYLLGPAGFGLFGIFGSVEALAESIAGMGVNSSGVRQIAEAVGSGNEERVAQTAAVLRRTSVILGLLGGLVLAVFARQISVLTFGTPTHSVDIALLSLAVLFTVTSAGQAALIQGMRRIADLATMNVWGNLFATLLGIPIVYFFRQDGVVWSLVAVAAMLLFTSWRYSRRIEVQHCSITTAQVVEETSALLKLGSVFMMGGLLLSAVAYLIRILIVRKSGLEAAGLYQSAWTLGGLYVGFIVDAMAADFYPRLTASAADDAVCNRLVNEQARVGVLLAGPGVLATLTFAPIAMVLFYSMKFMAAVEVLRWICIGTMLRVVTWPMGFIIVAKGRRAVFFWCEVACAGVYAALSWIFVSMWGLNGAGIAFFVYGIFHGLLHYPVVGRISGFRWSGDNYRTGAVYALLIAVVCGGFYVLPWLAADILGGVLTIAGGIYSLRSLLVLVPSGRLPRPVRWLISKVGFLAPANPGSHGH